MTGRVTSIAVDPSDSSGNTIYVGTTGGGVWRSSNAAGSVAAVGFIASTDDAAFSSAGIGSLSIGAISVQPPGGTGVLLAGTGDPNDALDSYYGQGILRSIDHGVTWQAIDESKDNQFSAALPHSFVGEGFAGFAWSTANPNLVVAAVTQALDGVVVNALQRNSFQGLYYSADAGATWQLAIITDGPGFTVQGPETNPAVSYAGAYSGNGATAVVWNPFRQMFFAAVQYHGYYSSPDGITWTRVAGQPGLGLSLTNCPSDANLPGDALSCPMVRGALAVQPKTGDMFAFTVGPFNTLEQGNPDQGIWRDVCAANGSSCSTGTANMFSQQLPVRPLENGLGAISEGDYDLWLAAVPAASGTDTLLYAGTQDIFKYSLLGGTTWQNMTNEYDCPVDSIAPYQHAVAVAGSMMFFGNDSGIWRTTDGIQQQSLCASDLQNLNSGLGSLAEVSSMAANPGRSGILMAAQGVIGTSATSKAAGGSPTAWPQVLDGYGSYVAIDPENPLNWYAAGTGVSIYLCGDGGVCDASLFPYAPVVGDAQTDADGETLLNPAVWILDPQNPTKMIVGTCRVWRGSVASGTANWSSGNALSPVLNESSNPSCDGEGQISALGASGTITTTGVAAAQEVLYAGMYSTDRGGIFLGGGTVAGHVFTQTLDANTTGPTAWIDISQYPSTVINGLADYQTFNPGGFTVSSVVADTHDSSGQTVYATIQGFSGNGVSEPTVYRSSNQGQSWMNVTANLPEIPVNGLVVDPGNANIVYVATDAGVFVTTDIANCVITGASCWSPFGIGLPDVPVTSIQAWGTGSAGLLRAGTYGRGVWETALVSEQPLTTISVQPISAALVFPNQQEQTVSLPQSITVTNTGNVALTVSALQFSRDAVGNTDFSETDTCSTAVPAGGSCVVTVLFDPTTTGSLNAVLTMIANLPDGQAQIFLSGTGTPADVRLNPPGLSFSQVAIGTTSTAQYIVVENMGNGAVSLGSPSVSNPYQITGNTCTDKVQPQSSCTVGIVFMPTANGLSGGTFSVPAGAFTLTASLSGMGVSPATDILSGAINGQLQFAPQVVGTVSLAQAVIITNTGGASLTGVNATATSSDFIVKSSCHTVVGQSNCAVLVSFAPTVAGSRTGNLTISDVLHNGANAQTISLVGTGVARAGVASVGPQSLDFNIQGVSTTSAPRTVTLTNNSGVPLTGLLFSATGSFQVMPGTCGLSLATDASCLPSVTFSPPATAGPQAGLLTITGTNQSFTTTLSGEGINFTLAAPVGVSPVSGASVETVVSGSPATYQVNVLPVGASTGTLALSCSGAPAGYSCTASGGSVPGSMQLQSGQQGSVTIAITPVASASNRPARLRPGQPGEWRAGLLALALIMPLWSLPRRRFSRKLLSRTKTRHGMTRLAAVLLLGGLAGCAFTTKSTGGGAGGGGTGTGVSTGVSGALTLTVSAPGIQKTAVITLVVEK